jgi:hypothetical protein
MRLGMGASRRSLTYGSSVASHSVRSLATSASSTTGALQGCSSATRRARRRTAFLTQGQRVRTTRDVVFDEGRGWTWDKAVDDVVLLWVVRQLHRRVRPLRGSCGSRQLSSTEHVYLSPRASTDLSATLSSHDLGVRNRTLTLIEREDDTRSWGNFLVYFSHSTTMPCPPRGWGYILIGC